MNPAELLDIWLKLQKKEIINLRSQILETFLRDAQAWEGLASQDSTRTSLDFARWWSKKLCDAIELASSWSSGAVSVSCAHASQVCRVAKIRLRTAQNCVSCTIKHCA